MVIAAQEGSKVDDVHLNDLKHFERHSGNTDVWVGPSPREAMKERYF
jgi:hypothetical protein